MRMLPQPYGNTSKRKPSEIVKNHRGQGERQSKLESDTIEQHNRNSSFQLTRPGFFLSCGADMGGWAFIIRKKLTGK